MGQGYDSYLVIGNQCNGMGFWRVGSFPTGTDDTRGPHLRRKST